MDANFPVAKPKQVRCVDGDSACDNDGVVNGVCDLRIRLCANSTFNPSCTLSGLASVTVEHALDNGDPDFDPDFQGLQNRVNTDFGFPDDTVDTADTCTTMGIIHVPIKGPLGNSNACGRQKKKLKLRALSASGPNGIKEDKDTLKLYCEPPLTDPDDPTSNRHCDPTLLFGGTFDRIQHQVFNQNCALSGCHDSQSQTGDLLLETGASYDNLVNHAPANFSALNAGWLRVERRSRDQLHRPQARGRLCPTSPTASACRCTAASCTRPCATSSSSGSRPAPPKIRLGCPAPSDSQEPNRHGREHSSHPRRRPPSAAADRFRRDRGGSAVAAR